MIYQYAAIVNIICVTLVLIGAMLSDPFPNTINWADKMGMTAIVVGFVAFWITLIACVLEV